MSSLVDVAVIGGGPAGLAGALALVRARKQVVLYDCWPPRNAAATEVRGFVTHDGTPPEEMRRLAREQLAEYPTFAARDDQRVKTIRGERGRFAIESDSGVLEARRVLLCVGLVDELPELPGYRELWGHSLFQCPNCHGWEARDQPLGYIAPDAECADWALLLRGWTKDLIVFTSGAFSLPTPVAAELETANVRVEERPIIGLRHDANGLVAVQLAGGAEVPRKALFVRPPQRQTSLVSELGVRLAARDLVAVDAKFETSIPGIYAGGDLMSHNHGAMIAAANGASAAHALDEALTRELVLAGLI
jgi:thioredoxin reductase